MYNIGERVEVYSDPLWLFLQAFLHLVLPFCPLGWTAVASGLAFTAGGVTLAGRAIQRLGTSRDEGLVIPVGLLIFAAVAPVWEFARLEISLVFFWIGLSFWLLVRTEAQRKSWLWGAIVIGLGPLIRPELTVMAAVFLVALGLVIAAPDWASPRPLWAREVAAFAVAVALPVAYKLFRMAYFAMFVSNTALAKSAGSSWWSQGFHYLWNFVAPYTLWLPMGLGVVLVAPCLRSWWRGHDRIGVVVALTPLVAGLLDIIYAIEVGGDYMHARLLPPGFCGLSVSIFAGTRHRREAMTLCLVAIAIWAAVSIGWFRPPAIESARLQQPIGDERTFWTGFSKHAHPIDPKDLSGTFTYRYAVKLHQLAERTPKGHQELVFGFSLSTAPARSKLPFSIATNVPAAGLIGDVAGPSVYLFDELSIANPIGSHAPGERNRQGKAVGPAWMIARFGIPGTLSPDPNASEPAIRAARKALTCEPLRDYLHAITAPLGFGLALSNIYHSFSYTTMTYSSNPIRAERQLCN